MFLSVSLDGISMNTKYVSRSNSRGSGCFTEDFDPRFTFHICQFDLSWRIQAFRSIALFKFLFFVRLLVTGISWKESGQYPH